MHKLKKTVYFSDEDIKKIKAIGKTFDLDKRADVIRRCIYITDTIANDLKKGERVYIRDKEGQFREVIL
jgi:hypothetical protein